LCEIQALEATKEPSENGPVVPRAVGSGLVLSGLVRAGGPGVTLSQRGVGPTRVLGAEGGPAWLESRLNGFLWPLSLPCLVSLGGVYLGASGEGVGQEAEEGVVLTKGTQEGKRKGGIPSLGETGRQEPLTNE